MRRSLRAVGASRRAVRGSATLEGSGLTVRFASLTAVDDVYLSLAQGEILGLIGPNGAGKTTLVNMLTGFQPSVAGRVTLDGHDVTGWSPQRLARRGLARTFQSVRLFPRLSVLENITLGALALGVSRRQAEAEAWSLLDRMRLAGRAALPANSLSHGEERQIGIFRALAMRPAFLLLDEPAAGLNEAESNELASMLARLPDEFGFGLLVIEHDMRLIMGLCHRIQVMNYGKTIMVGSPDEVRANSAVLEAYLGSKRARNA